LTCAHADYIIRDTIGFLLTEWGQRSGVCKMSHLDAVELMVKPTTLVVGFYLASGTEMRT
jgi:hypothetical protein